jgi:hypothetical protein
MSEQPNKPVLIQDRLESHWQAWMADSDTRAAALIHALDLMRLLALRGLALNITARAIVHFPDELPDHDVIYLPLTIKQLATLWETPPDSAEQTLSWLRELGFISTNQTDLEVGEMRLLLGRLEYRPESGIIVPVWSEGELAGSGAPSATVICKNDTPEEENQDEA